MLLCPWSVGVIPTWVSSVAILIFEVLSDLQSTYLSWDQRSHDKSWAQLCNCHHGKFISKPGFLGEREKRREERDWLGCPGWVSSSSVVLKGKTVFNFNSAPLPSSLAYEAYLGTEREVLHGTFQTFCLRQEPYCIWDKNLFPGLHTWVFHFYLEENGTIEACLCWWWAQGKN